MAMKYCSLCYSLKQGYMPMKGEYKGNNFWLFSCTSHNWTKDGSGCAHQRWLHYRNGKWWYESPAPPKPKAHWRGGEVDYFDGQKRTISQQLLKKIKSTVTTHEGNLLTDKAGRDYMDKYSKTLLGKDMAGSYNSHEIVGEFGKVRKPQNA